MLLCEDSLGFRMLAAAWLEDADDMELVGVAETGNQAVEVAGQLRPQVVLLDPLLRDAAPGIAIALVSGMPTELLATEAGRTGVEAFCSKASEPSGFLTVVREARAVSQE